MNTPQESVVDISYQIRELVAQLQQEIDSLREDIEKLAEENYLLTEALKNATTNRGDV